MSERDLVSYRLDGIDMKLDAVQMRIDAFDTAHLARVDMLYDKIVEINQLQGKHTGYFGLVAVLCGGIGSAALQVALHFL